MGSRYGRNKRRAAREAIAALEVEVATARDRAERAIDDAHAANMECRRFGYMLDCMVDRLIQSFGPESALLPIEYASQKDGADIRRWPVKLKAAPVALNASIAYADTTVTSVNLLDVIAEIVQSPDYYPKFGALIRFRVRDRNGRGEFGEAAYFVSRESFQAHGVSREELLHLIDVAMPRLLETLNGERRRG